jgi:dihydrofolate reductase
MRKLLVFNNVSLDGFIADVNGDMSWAHSPDPEWQAFTAENAKGESQMLFGRKTYDLMASFWPTPQAIQGFPSVAEAMNKAPKVVFSRTLDNASWSNTRLVKGDPAAEVRKLKNEPGPGVVIFGSGTIVSLLAQEGLIDEFQIVVIPVVLGKGKSMFEGIKDKLPLKLTKTRSFCNGNVLLCYEPGK